MDRLAESDGRLAIAFQIAAHEAVVDGFQFERRAQASSTRAMPYFLVNDKMPCMRRTASSPC
jgi:chloramphenicol O-acetyltransferase